MVKSIKWLAASALCLAAVGAQAQVNQVRVWAAACANCHGTDGRALQGNEALAGKELRLSKHQIWSTACK